MPFHGDDDDDDDQAQGDGNHHGNGIDDDGGVDNDSGNGGDDDDGKEHFKRFPFFAVVSSSVLSSPKVGPHLNIQILTWIAVIGSTALFLCPLICRDPLAS